MDAQELIDELIRKEEEFFEEDSSVAEQEMEYEIITASDYEDLVDGEEEGGEQNLENENKCKEV